MAGRGATVATDQRNIPLAHVLLTRRFAPLFITQFLSAFADNVLKNGLAFVILASFAGSTSEALVSVAGAIFVLPFFLLSALGGEVADTSDKASVARYLKLAELATSALAALGFVLNSTPILFAALFGFGIISALFGPVKYGILPDHLPDDVPLANAAIEGSTFLAILAGAALGAVAGDGSMSGRLILAGCMVALSVACLIAVRFVPATAIADPAHRPDRNILRSTLRSLAEIWAEARLWRCAIGTSVFWFAGATVMAVLPSLVLHVLHGEPIVVTIHLAAFAISLATGSFVAVWLGNGRIVLLPSTIGAAIMAIAALDAGYNASGLTESLKQTYDIGSYFSHAPATRLAVDLAFIAFGGGLVVVPTFAAVQTWAVPSRRAQAVGAVNILNAAAMVLATLAVTAIQALGADIGTVLLLAGGVIAAASAWMFFRLPTDRGSDAAAIVARCGLAMSRPGVGDPRRSDGPPRR